MVLFALIALSSTSGQAKGSGLDEKVSELVSVEARAEEGADGQSRGIVTIEIHGKLEQGHSNAEVALASVGAAEKVRVAMGALTQRKDLAGLALVVEKANGTKVVIGATGFPCWLYPDLC